MLDIAVIRRDFARHLLAHAGSRYSLDAALMYVVSRAYEQGISDAMQVPAVLTDPVPDVDAGMAPGMRSPLAARPDSGRTPRASGAPAGAGEGGSAESGDPAPARKTAVIRSVQAELAALRAEVALLQNQPQ